MVNKTKQKDGRGVDTLRAGKDSADRPLPAVMPVTTASGCVGTGRLELLLPPSRLSPYCMGTHSGPMYRSVPLLSGSSVCPRSQSAPGLDALAAAPAGGLSGGDLVFQAASELAVLVAVAAVVVALYPSA